MKNKIKYYFIKFLDFANCNFIELLIGLVIFIILPFIMAVFHWLITSTNQHFHFLAYVKWYYFFISLLIAMIVFMALSLYFHVTNKTFKLFADFSPIIQANGKPLANAIRLNKNTILKEEALKLHTIVCGRTGVGKTNLLYQLLSQRIAIDDKAKVVFVNGKYDSDLSSDLYNLDIRYKIVDYKSNDVKYDVFKNKNIQEILTLFLEYEDFIATINKDAAVGFHKKKEKELITLIFSLFTKTNTEICFENIAKYFNQKAIYKISKTLDNSYFDWIYKYDEDIYFNLRQKFLDIANIKCMAMNCKDSYSITDFINSDDNCLVFNINTNNVDGVLLGKIITLDLRQHLEAKNPKIKVMIIMDEFGAFANKQIQILNQQFRSRNVEMVLSFQGITQLTAISDSFRDDIINNSCNLFAFNILDPTTAEYISKCFGTKKTFEITKQIKDSESTGLGSKKLVDEFYVHPNDLKSNLSLGWCYFKTLSNSGDFTIPRKIKIDKII